jgi:hypothetical protein
MSFRFPPALLALTLLSSAACGSDPVLVVPNHRAVDVNPALPELPEPQHCPELLRVEALPLETGVGDRLELYAEAIDPDGDELRYRWRAGLGSIVDPRAPSTQFVCETRGPSEVQLTVSDARGCERGERFVVSCR